MPRMFAGTYMTVCDFAAETNVAEGNGDAGGEGDVAKLLERQTLEDKEREDGEEGKPSSSAEPVSCLQRDETWSCLCVSHLTTNESNGAFNRWG